jgi:hypothetical protein
MSTAKFELMEVSIKERVPEKPIPQEWPHQRFSQIEPEYLTLEIKLIGNCNTGSLTNQDILNKIHKEWQEIVLKTN